MKLSYKMTVLFIDKINFHPRNFPELYNFLDAENITYAYDDFGDQGLKKRFGSYDEKHQSIAPYYQKLRNLSSSELYRYEAQGVQVFQIAKHEIFSKVVTDSEWYDELLPYDDSSIFKKLQQYNHDDLLLNCSAACFWLDYWQEHFQKNPSYRYLCIFGNSLIYSLAASALAERYNITPYVFEHLFTGNHYFIENRSSAIQGHAYTGAFAQKTPSTYDVVFVNKAIAEMANKNVITPPFRYQKLFQNDEKNILITTQVVNDFSLLSSANQYIGSIALYKKVISELLHKTSHNIIVKAHPYEKTKHPERKNITYDELAAYIHALPPAYNKRIRIFLDYNLSALAANTDCCFSICSQSAIELLAQGTPVSTLGSAFYSGQGFTHDFATVDAFVKGAVDQSIFTFNKTSAHQFYTYCSALLSKMISAETSREFLWDKFKFSTAIKDEHKRIPKSAPPPKIVASVPQSQFRRKCRKLLLHPLLFVSDAKKNKSKKRAT